MDNEDWTALVTAGCFLAALVAGVIVLAVMAGLAVRAFEIASG